MNISEITPVIITKNSERTICKCLDALRFFKNVIVYDNGSNDDTLKICNFFSNVRVVQGEFYGFGRTKNLAVEYADTDWVLLIDSDEFLEEVSMASLIDWDFSNAKKVGVLFRENWFCGKKIKTNGWGGDFLVRLYNKKEYSVTNAQVHEKINIDSTAIKINVSGKLVHDAVYDIKQILDKAQLYSDMYAMSEKRKLYPFPIIVLKSIFAFIRSYFIKLGVFSGWRGFVISFGDSIGVFFKYAKVYQRKKAEK